MVPTVWNCPPDRVSEASKGRRYRPLAEVVLCNPLRAPEIDRLANYRVEIDDDKTAVTASRFGFESSDVVARLSANAGELSANQNLTVGLQNHRIHPAVGGGLKG